MSPKLITIVSLSKGNKGTSAQGQGVVTTTMDYF